MESSDLLKDEQELKGLLTIKLKPHKTLDEFCERNFTNYSSERFEAIAIRFYSGKETQVTLYALDKPRKSSDIGTLPVKKFKTDALPITDLLTFIEDFNFTLSLGNYPLENIEVINK